MASRVLSFQESDWSREMQRGWSLIQNYMENHRILLLLRDIASRLIQYRRNILCVEMLAHTRIQARIQRRESTFRLYLVVTLVAKTPFLMLLVARWLRTV